MKRIDFIRKSLLGTGILVTGSAMAKTLENKIDELRPLSAIGFNHLPFSKSETMNNNIVIHRANTRGQANHGWLNAKHSFSFASYYNPERMHFGVLRVLNDDTIAGGMGFSTHPHDNMEIVTIPLEGVVEHKDSMGNSGVINAGQVQVMSAGTGVHHSEFNHLKDKDLKLFQIWLFPDQHNVEPRYDQIDIPELKQNEFVQIVSPNPADDGVWIHQQAWISMAKFDAGISKEYIVKRENNGVYCMVVEGEVTIDGHKLSQRDAIGVWETDKIRIESNSSTKILVLDVPMKID